MAASYRPGQSVWLTPGGNLARIYRFETLPVPAKVVSIKRKYFYVKREHGHDEIKFEIETGKSVLGDCNSSWTIWDSPQAYLDEKERRDKIWKIYAAFRSPCTDRTLSLDAVRLIYDTMTAEGVIET